MPQPDQYDGDDLMSLFSEMKGGSEVVDLLRTLEEFKKLKDLLIEEMGEMGLETEQLQTKLASIQFSPQPGEATHQARDSIGDSITTVLLRNVQEFNEALQSKGVQALRSQIIKEKNREYHQQNKWSRPHLYGGKKMIPLELKSTEGLVAIDSQLEKTLKAFDKAMKANKGAPDGIYKKIIEVVEEIKQGIRDLSAALKGKIEAAREAPRPR